MFEYIVTVRLTTGDENREIYVFTHSEKSAVEAVLTTLPEGLQISSIEVAETS